MDIAKKYGLTNKIYTMLFKEWMSKYEGCAPSNHQQRFISEQFNLPKVEWEKFTMAELFNVSATYKREVTTFITSEHRTKKEINAYKEMFFNKS
jgi:hypothetical protein